MIPTPFTNMALSLSGGGYRATTFHLGSMSYLHEKRFKGQNLLKNVRIISTISGGTITGVMYAHKLSRKEGFNACFDKIYTLLDKDELVNKALKKLNHPATWKNGYKTRDLINAFAEVYNEDFYDEGTFSELFNSKLDHLTDAIFGASEFTYGIQFRLQENHDAGRFGNYYLNLPDNIAKKIRLADATAASSCFPGGFEPIIMPKDFGNGPQSEVVTHWQEKKYQSTAIMDGGIIDNQGIEGVKLAEDRWSNKLDHPFVGTYFVSDVSGEMMTPYEVPVLKHQNWKDYLTFKSINWIAAIVFVVSLISLFLDPPFWSIILCTIAMTLVVLYFSVFLLVRKHLKNGLAGMFGADAVRELMRNLKVLSSTPIYILSYLVKFRVSSVVKMVSDLFLRRIRRLQLNSLYSDNTWNYRLKTNNIYDLSDVSDLTPALQSVIEMANQMPTTLWFTTREKQSKMLDNLIAAGQVTMCRNVIRYIERIRDGGYREKVWTLLSYEDQEAISELHASAKIDWEKFLVDPFWLLKQEKKRSAT